MKHAIFVQRKFALSFIGTIESVNKSIDLIKDNPAINKVDYDSTATKLLIEYDQILLNFTGVLAILSELGISYKKGFVLNCRSSWYDYLDTTARENASAPPPACCNKPPKR